MVHSAQKVKDKREEATVVGPSGVPSISGASVGSGLYNKTRAEWIARAEVYKIEKELQDARNRLDNIRKR